MDMRVIFFLKNDKTNYKVTHLEISFFFVKVVYEDLSMVALTAPYIPGFLAFREADFLVEKVEKLRQLNPQMVPQVIRNRKRS